MAALPKKKISKVRGKTRRAGSFKLVKPKLVKCPKCGALKIPHTVCPSCGFYGERKVMTTVSERKVALYLKRKKKAEAAEAKAKAEKEKRKKKSSARKTKEELQETKKSDSAHRSLRSPAEGSDEATRDRRPKETLKKVLEDKKAKPRRGFFDIFRGRRGEK